MEKTDAFIDTYTGTRADVPVPKPEQIKIEDIAHALSMQCRYTGHTRKFYSVAEHSVRATKIVGKEDKLAVLLHDASEAYLSDINRPMKSFLPEYRTLEAKIDKVICKAFGVSKPNKKEIKRADEVMLATEARDLMPTTEGWMLAEEPLQKRIVPWTSRNAEEAFLAVYRRLTK